MQTHENDNDLRPGPPRQDPRQDRAEDDRLRTAADRLDELSRSLGELRARRVAIQEFAATSRDREHARNAIAESNAKLVEIQAELDGLRIAMRNRAVIEQAKGMLMLRLRIDEDKAFDYLRTMSNRTNRKLVEVAAEVVRTRAGEPGLQ